MMENKLYELFDDEDVQISRLSQYNLGIKDFKSWFRIDPNDLSNNELLDLYVTSCFNEDKYTLDIIREEVLRRMRY